MTSDDDPFHDCELGPEAILGTHTFEDVLFTDDTETAQWYDLDAAVAAMYRPLQDEFDTTEDFPVALPSEAEFMALKKQYGVS